MLCFYTVYSNIVLECIFFLRNSIFCYFIPLHLRYLTTFVVHYIYYYLLYTILCPYSAIFHILSYVHLTSLTILFTYYTMLICCVRLHNVLHHVSIFIQPKVLLLIHITLIWHHMTLQYVTVFAAANHANMPLCHSETELVQVQQCK